PVERSLDFPSRHPKCVTDSRCFPWSRRGPAAGYCVVPISTIERRSPRFRTLPNHLPGIGVTPERQPFSVQTAASEIARPTAAGDPRQSQESNFEPDGTALHFRRSRGHQTISPEQIVKRKARRNHRPMLADAVEKVES